MTQVQINSAFLTALNAIDNTIEVAYEGVSFTPTLVTPYIEAYFLPADNDGIHIDNSNYDSLGIFQITLKYPFGSGSGAIATQAQKYIDYFYKGRKFTDVRILDTPRLTNLGKDGDRIVQVISINYACYISV